MLNSSLLMWFDHQELLQFQPQETISLSKTHVTLLSRLFSEADLYTVDLTVKSERAVIVIVQ